MRFRTWVSIFAFALTTAGAASAGSAAIERTAPDQFQIERAKFDAAFPEGFMASVRKSARLVPAATGGTVQGLAVLDVQPGGLCAQLGLENRDTLLSVNGYPLASAGQTTEAYARVANASAIRLVLRRQQTDLTFTYAVR